jgi:predicted esterase
MCFCACNHAEPPGIMAIHDLHEPSAPVVVPTSDNDFYRLPFPNVLRMGADGTVDLTRYPRAFDPGTIVYQYIETIDAELTGFGESSGIYFRFDGAIDETTLPADPESSITDDATAYVVDITPGSPTYQKKSPVLAHFVAAAYDFIGPNWVVLLPFPGIPLRENTTYAAILTDGIKPKVAGRVHRHPDLDAALQKNPSSDARIAAAQTAYKPLTDWLATQPKVAQQLVNATVFTTQNATPLIFAARKAVYDSVPAPQLLDLSYIGEDLAGVDDHYEAHYLGPNYQQGDAPYLTSGGNIVTDANGVPQLVRMEDLRFAMTVPEGTMPPNGWPVVIYMHGTGGDYTSFIRDKSARNAAKVQDSSGKVIAQMAMVSIDQVLHGPRDPTHSDPDLTFFNFRNPSGARYNPIQGALDDFQLLRLVKSINVASSPMRGVPIKFDPDRIYYKGHSQGSLTGAIYLAAEPEIKAAVLSGAGAVLIQTLLNKRSPIDIPSLLANTLRDPFDQYHPLLSLLQAYLEISDPANYGRYYFNEPPAGFAPKSIYQSLGYIDTYAPIPNGKAQMLCAGLQPIGPMLAGITDKFDPTITDGSIAGLDLLNLSWGDAPTSLNMASGTATGVLVEYKAPPGDDGHFVVFDVPAAVQQSNRFLATHAKTGVAQLTLP